MSGLSCNLHPPICTCASMQCCSLIAPPTLLPRSLPVSVDMAVSQASIRWNLSGPMYCCIAMLSRAELGTSSLSAPRGLGGRGNRTVMAGALRTCRVEAEAEERGRGRGRGTQTTMRARQGQ